MRGDVEWSRSELLALVAMAIAVFVDGLDASIVNIALPTIAASFGIDAGQAAWVTIMYFMMIAGLMLSFGRLADSGHIKKIYIVGFVLFTIGSLACGFSGDLIMLVASRAVQGLGAAMLGAVAPLICVKLVSPTRLGVAMSILMVGGAIGFGCGPAVGGFIVDVASWHWAFFINVPVGIGAVLLALKVLPNDGDTERSKLDLKGSILLFVAVICGVYVLEMFSIADQTMICIILAVVMVLSLEAFVFAENRAKYPMLNLSVFREWRFSTLVLGYILVNLAYMGIAYLLPFYLNKEMDVSNTFAGLLILVPSVVTMIVSIPAGWYADSHGRRGLCVVACAAMLAAAIGYYVIEPEMGWIPFIPVGLAGGVFWGLCGASLTSYVIDLAPEKEKGMASTLTAFLYYVGGTVGTALFASLATYGSGTSGIPLDLIPPGDFLFGYHFAVAFAIALSVAALIMVVAVVKKRVNSA